MHEHFREVSVQDKDANYLLILKRIGCHRQGFPEREIALLPKGSYDPPHRNVWTSLRATRTHLWDMTSSEMEITHETEHGRHRNAHRRTEIERGSARELTTPLALPQNTNSDTFK